ncbi:MAG: YlmC/YmxH family sporulation protein [Ruminococcaceae bacterium]|nr:YlmC/YmxH family sporulation protein [Oscillospiraceae bacterium]
MDTFLKMQKKEVINADDGTRLGYVSDIEIDTQSGSIKAIRIPSSTRAFNLFGKNEDHIIAWERIKKIGDDIILIN